MGMIVGQKTVELENGLTVTTFQLSDEAKRGLTVDPEKFRRACDESIEQHRRHADWTEKFNRSLARSDVFMAIMDCFLAAFYISTDLYFIGVIWIVMALISAIDAVRKFRNLRSGAAST